VTWIAADILVLKDGILIEHWDVIQDDAAPSRELFDDQDQDSQELVLPSHTKARVSVEQASDFGWSKYTGRKGHNIGIQTFGASAPLKQLLKRFGFNVETVVAAAKSQIARHGERK